MLEPPQLTLNGPHCVAGEYDGVKPTVAARGKKKARPRNNVRLGTREGGISHRRGHLRASLLGLDGPWSRGAASRLESWLAAKQLGRG